MSQKSSTLAMQNRDLAWLKFNERVLEESNFLGNPLLERLKFISIFANNLDEFFMVRVGSLTDYMLFAPHFIDNKTGLNAKEQLDAIFSLATVSYELMTTRFFCVKNELAEYGLEHVQPTSLTKSDTKFLEGYFLQNIMPLLSPQIVGQLNPFPHIENKRLHIAVQLELEEKTLFGIIPVPKTLERIVFIKNTLRFVLLEDLVYYFAQLAFNPYLVTEKTVLAVTRNSDIDFKEARVFDEDINVDYPQFMRNLLKKRKRLSPVRLELQYDISKQFKEFLLKKLGLKEKHSFTTTAPLDLSHLFNIGDNLPQDIKDSLSWPPYTPTNIFADNKTNLLQLAQKQDILLTYPYESISPFVRMLSQAADDDSVVSIKITLYRLDLQSRLATSLMRAAENGKEVIVMVELRARFDEANNLNWSDALQEAGCTVIYGLEDYKVHSKICLITKKVDNKLTHITQIGTGNYNEKTAKVYTDYSLITGNEEIGNDASEFFKNLLLNNMGKSYKHLWVAPNFFKQNVIDCINDEIEVAKKGLPTQIVIKCNSLTDKEIILKLAEASQNGVKVYLIIRGACCLIPNIAGFTDNIKVTSIVGRFLEHSRMYCFGEPSNSKVFIASADLMTRNTERRVEIACPILDDSIKQSILNDIQTLLSDNTKAWEQDQNTQYKRHTHGSNSPINSQEIFMENAQNKNNTTNITTTTTENTSHPSLFQKMFGVFQSK